MTRPVRVVFVLVLVLSLAGPAAGGGDDVSPSLPLVTPSPEPVEPPVAPIYPIMPPEPFIHGQCGRAVNRCDAGRFADLFDTDTDHRWSCGGEHGGITASCALPKPPKPGICGNGAAASDNPEMCIRGQYTIPGIDTIPLDRVKVTNEEMQKMFVIAEAGVEHAQMVGGVACESYITKSGGCRTDSSANRTGTIRYLDGTTESRTGSAPFTELVDLNTAAQDAVDNTWLEQTMRSMGTVKIANYSVGGSHAPAHIGNGNLPYLIVHSVGNGSDNLPWFHDLLTADQKDLVKKAIAANKLIFVGGWDRDANGNYVRHDASDSCKGLDDGCLWAQMEFRPLTTGPGTSFSAPQFSAALASVLAVFPDTSHQDLAAFGKSCAKKTGEGIDGPDGLLAVSGGLGVADFRCMGDVVTALTNLPTGDAAAVTINGNSVQVDGRRVSLPSSGMVGSTVLAGIPTGDSVQIAPSGQYGALFTAEKKTGKVFIAGEVGARDNFFGFRDWHEAVAEARLRAGHENLFVVISEQHSLGGGPIRSANGRTVALVARDDVILSEDTTLVFFAGAERFLGGSADISSGSVRLNSGEWDHRVSVSLEKEINKDTTVGVSAVTLTHGGRDAEHAVGLRFERRF